MLNIYDIARLSGVSIATVSRVVNGNANVSPKTREKVMEVIKENNYTPNVFARGLGLDSMKTVGLMCPDISDEYMARAISYLEKELRQYGYDCILGCSGYEQEQKEKQLNMLLQKRIDVLILIGSTYAGTGNDPYEVGYIEEAAKKTPVFLINGRIEGENIYCTYADDYSAIYEVTDKLIKEGRRNILFLYDSDSFSGKEKQRGYEEALLANRLPVRGELKLRTRNDITYTKELLLACTNLNYDSIVATDDAMAVGAIKYGRLTSRQIPEQLSIVGYNNSALAQCSEPELTSVDSCLRIMCKNTVERIINLKNGLPIEKNIDYKCEIVKRCTTYF